MEGPATKRPHRVHRQEHAGKKRKLEDTTVSLPEKKRSRKGANSMAEELLASGCAITGEIILRVLRMWSFTQNVTRANVMPPDADFVFSETLGLVSTRNGKVTASRLTKRYPAVFQILAHWLRQAWPLSESFPFTSISVNKNYAARM